MYEKKICPYCAELSLTSNGQSWDNLDRRRKCSNLNCNKTISDYFLEESSDIIVQLNSCTKFISDKIKSKDNQITNLNKQIKKYNKELKTLKKNLSKLNIKLQSEKDQKLLAEKKFTLDEKVSFDNSAFEFLNYMNS